MSNDPRQKGKLRNERRFDRSELKTYSFLNFIPFLLKARIAFLQGERKGQENLKNGLVRRIKMLEYALKQERLKYSKLKYGTTVAAPDNSGEGNTAAAAAMASGSTIGDDKADLDEEIADMLPPLDVDTGTDNYIAVSNFNWKQGRQLLRQ